MSPIPSPRPRPTPLVWPALLSLLLGWAWAVWLGLGTAWAATPPAAPASETAPGELRPVPHLNARVLDETGNTLDAAQQQRLNRRLAEVEARTGSQIVILVVPRTAPEDIAAYAWRVADAWKIGRRQVGDGVLIVVARDDRKMRIEVAKSLEGAIPDLAARQIMDQTLKPAFRSGQYAQGLEHAVDAVDARIGAEGLPAPTAAAAPTSALDLSTALLLFFIGVPLVGSVACALVGHRLGSAGTSLAAGVAGGVYASSLGWGIAAGAVAGVLVAALGVGQPLRARNRATGGGGNGLTAARSPSPRTSWTGGWDSGGWSAGGSDSSSDGGFSSGGGGDFGGGGASGDW